MPVSMMRRVWREGATRRVTVGSAVVAAGGATIASMRHLHPTAVLRTSASCALITCPLFALREVLAGGLAVDGPVASAIAGGVAGYVGALAFSSGSLRAVSHGAMVAGVGAGLFDVMLSNVDYQWKAFLIARRDTEAATAAIQMKTEDNPCMDDMKMPVAEVVVPNESIQQDTAAVTQGVLIKAKAADDANKKMGNGNKTLQADLPVWLPSGGINGKDEYDNLLQSQKVTATALRQEQDRIARLLATIEHLKNDGTNSVANEAIETQRQTS